ncbi:hypothetical protein [Pedobacter helvus]|uniref:Uncharacterized protein n=1 Tax=Pedobacter helvus TaxID=2563444 RepID=A0ABW9JL35_9SPHI|nr:hypothetical protein [Pedobacter ureilyticus]
MKKIGLLLLILLALLAINIFALSPPYSTKITKETAFKLNVSLTVSEGAQVPKHFADTLLKAQQLLSKVFSSAEFKEIMSQKSFSDSAYSKSKKKCFDVIYDPETGRISGKAVYDNLLKENNVSLSMVIKNNGDKQTTMGFAGACSYKITTYDFWLVEGGALSQRLARHIAHEFTHIRGYRHDNLVPKAHKWGLNTKEDPALGVGSVVGEILTRWAKFGII